MTARGNLLWTDIQGIRGNQISHILSTDLSSLSESQIPLLHFAPRRTKRKQRHQSRKRAAEMVPVAGSSPNANPRRVGRRRRANKGGAPSRTKSEPNGRGRNSREAGMVPPVGLEPTLLAELDFESSASTNSTTGARFHRTGALS